jgi:hypothetical protein
MKRQWLADQIFVEEEQRRIEPYTMQGEQSVMVQHDMGQWAKANGMWANAPYSHIVEAHAVARGWTQEEFTGLEIIE